MDVRHINNALKELKDCIRGLLHLGPNVITFRTVLHLGQLLHFNRFNEVAFKQIHSLRLRFLHNKQHSF